MNKRKIFFNSKNRNMLNENLRTFLFSLILLFYITSCFGKGKDSVLFGEDIYIENNHIKIGLKKFQTYIVNSFFDKNLNKNLLSGIYIWYQGKSDKEDKFYEEWNEKKWNLIEVKKEGNNKVLIKSENIDFILFKEVSIEETLPLCKIKYTLIAKNNLSPRLNTFPLIDLSSIFENLYIFSKNEFKEYKLKDKKKIDLSEEKVCVLGDPSFTLFLAIILHNSFQTCPYLNYLSRFSIQDLNWCKRVSIIHDYDGWRKYFNKGDKIETEFSFFLFYNFDKNFWKEKIESIISQSKNNIRKDYQKVFREEESEKKYPSPLSYKLYENSEFLIWYENSVKKVYPKTKTPTSFDNMIKVSMAKGEGESFQIIVFPNKDIKLFNIKISDFKNKDFTLNENFFECYYLNYEILETPYGEEIIPDRLIPINKVLPFSLKKEINNIFWFSIYTPPNIPAGDYNGEIMLEFDKNGKRDFKNIKVKIHVWDFELPKRLPFRAFGLLWRYYLLPQYFSGENSAEKLDMDYIRWLAKYHINTDLIANSRENRLKIFDGRRVDLSKFEERAKEAIENLNYNVISIPNVYLANWSWKKGQKVSFLNLDPESEDFENLYSFYLSKVKELLERNNWFEISILYIWDEIYGEDAYTLLDEKLSKLIWNIDKRFKIFIVGPPDKKIIKNCNIICPGDFTAWWSEKAEKVIKEIKTERKEIWCYLNSETFIPDQPAIITRLVPWKCWTRGITGYLQWSFDYWQGNFTQNGSVWLFYPNKTEPQPSVRLEYFRDGIEDFTYFEILKNLSSEEIKKIEKEIFKIVPKYRDSDYTSLEKIVSLREKIGETIERLTKKQ